MNDSVLEMERLIPAPPERVFEYWTEPELVAKWFGPGDFDVPSSQLDLRPGGKWRTTIRSPEGKLRSVSGVYSAIEPPRRLVFTWAWDDDDGVRGHENSSDCHARADAGRNAATAGAGGFPKPRGPRSAQRRLGVVAQQIGAAGGLSSVKRN